MFDKNHDGKISSEELGCVIRTLGHNHSSKEIEEMIKNVDTNGKSIISGRGLSNYTVWLTWSRKCDNFSQ